jgi:hypothetical protein
MASSALIFNLLLTTILNYTAILTYCASFKLFIFKTRFEGKELGSRPKAS